MAKIKEIELKNVKNTVGREGYGFAANIYMNNKKIGIVADYADGAPYNFEFDSKESEKEIEKRILQYYKENPPVDTLKLYDMELKDFDIENIPRENKDELDSFDKEVFFEELYSLKDKENGFKKAQKKGKMWCMISYYHIKGIGIPVDSTYCVNTDSAIKAKEIVNNLVDSERAANPTAYAMLYTSLKDFIVD